MKLDSQLVTATTYMSVTRTLTCIFYQCIGYAIWYVFGKHIKSPLGFIKLWSTD